jgi:hypothetical protein
MSAPIDLALAPDPDNPNYPMLHRADCPAVRRQADRGELVVTMIGCQGLPKKVGLRYHDCLEEGA